MFGMDDVMDCSYVKKTMYTIASQKKKSIKCRFVARNAIFGWR